MARLLDGVYNLFFKRTTIYVPVLFVGAYFTNEAIDYAVDTFWKSHNKGKTFSDMVAAREAAA